MSVDPHLEEVVPYSPLGSQTAAVEVVSALGGFVAALALMPSRWLLMTAFFAGFCGLSGAFRYVSWRRKLRRRLAAAPAPPSTAVEVRRRRRPGRRVVLAPAFLLGAAWLSNAVDHSPFAVGLLGAATLVGTALAAEVVELRVVRRWERRHGRVLTSLLLGDGDVFYVERGGPQPDPVGAVVSGRGDSL